MDSIDSRRALRTQFMKEAYELAQGHVNAHVDTGEVAKRMGLDFPENQEHLNEILDIVNYLDEEGLIAQRSAWASIMLTNKGVHEVEKATEQANRPTHYLGPLSIVYAEGNISHSPIQQSSPGATQSLNIINQSDLQQLEAFLWDLQESVHQLELRSDQQAELQAEIKTLEAQVASPKPKREIIKPALRSIVRMLVESVAGNVAADALVSHGTTILDNLP